jgi:hypothetical protein
LRHFSTVLRIEHRHNTLEHFVDGEHVNEHLVDVQPVLASR